jgi:hypothetical protein
MPWTLRWVQPASAPEIMFSSRCLSNVGTNHISAFALYLTNSSSVGLPSVVPGADQTNLTCFVDDFDDGIYCVTGFILSGSSISNGHSATLLYSISNGVAAGNYPISFTAAPPLNAPTGPNPEGRALVTSSLISGTATGGVISVVTSPATSPVITGIVPQPGRVFLLQFNGETGFSYTVEASTNLFTWQPLTNIQAGENGFFSLMDTAATNYPHRFYRLKNP